MRSLCDQTTIVIVAIHLRLEWDEGNICDDRDTKMIIAIGR